MYLDVVIFIVHVPQVCLAKKSKYRYTFKKYAWTAIQI